MPNVLTRLVALGLLVASTHANAQTPGKPIDFSREVRPILSSHCFQCHGPDAAARKAGLRLDRQDDAYKELKSGAIAVVPHQPDESELIERITSDDDSLVMPPKKFGKPLDAKQIEVLKKWIAQGGKYTKHWAYVAPERPTVPAVNDRSWPINPIDFFVLNRLEGEGFKPSSEAERDILIRRVALDLTGLPPTVDEAERFRNDTRPDAYERMVDDMLSKPGYGERWAAVWLDLARYADSQGFSGDPPRNIWRWRDWVIQALNNNVPYDVFTIEQLAGDLLPNATPDQLIATGFHRNTLNNTEGGVNIEEVRHSGVVDRVNTTMQAWMGTSMACAQCHDHKYDPFKQKEYYQLFAIFNNTEFSIAETPMLETSRIGFDSICGARKAELAAAKKELEAASKKADGEFDKWLAGVDRSKLPKEIKDVLAIPAEKREPHQKEQLLAHHRSVCPDWKAVSAKAAAAEARYNEVGTTTLIFREGPTRPTHVHIRGELTSLGAAVTTGLPEALHAGPKKDKLDRLDLARWIVDPQNPLTSRVAVNRLWQEIFGLGLVETSEEFGMQGELPSHPELLDWLATEYLRLRWDTKQLLKTIVCSATYRQSSAVSPELAKRDPFNRLMTRGPRVRLSAEAVHDQALFVAGLLSPKLYGPPVQPPQSLTSLATDNGGGWEVSKGDDRFRRALYTRWRRNSPYPSMTTFDMPTRGLCTARRIRTNTPLQALVTLNDPVYVEAAQALARRIIEEGGATTQAAMVHAFRLVLTRPPTDYEEKRLVALFESSRSSLAADNARATALATKPLGPVPAGMNVADAAAWTVVANVLLNLDETLAKP
jgi:hypothetical protein